MRVHDLTDKEIQQLKDAASTIKKFAKYIDEVNSENRTLKKDLDESIKSGDVTAVQKTNLLYFESAEKQFDLLCDKIHEKCPKDCGCEMYKWNNCKIYQEFLIADWMRGVAHGNSFDWEMVFKWALDGMLREKGLVK